jgi:UDP-glucose 6-dehydrogenase
MDPRISNYGAVMHGKPFGGFCLPKDLNALISTAELACHHPLVLEAVWKVNEQIQGEMAEYMVNHGRIGI